MSKTEDSFSVNRSQLFTIRLWSEELGNGRIELRGQVQHVLSSETYYFRDWVTLIATLDRMWANCENNQSINKRSDL